MEFWPGWLNWTVPPAPTEKLFQLMMALPVFWLMTVLSGPVLVMVAEPITTLPPVGPAAAASVHRPMADRLLAPRRTARRIAAPVLVTAPPSSRNRRDSQPFDFPRPRVTPAR